MIEVNNNIRIEFIVIAITIILRQLLAYNCGRFWQPAEFENVANRDFENLKHLQNPGHLSMTAPSIYSCLFACFFCHTCPLYLGG